MIERNVSLILMLVTGAMLALIFTFSNRDETQFLKADQLFSDINALSPSAAGFASSSGVSEPAGELRRKNAYVGGTKATGRVSDIYLKVEQGVFLSLESAPETLRKSAERWVDVQFPELLANGAGAARAFINDSQAGIGVGDIVEIKFAHKSSKETAQFFPVKEITRVTELVARRDEMLAKDYEQRILARTGHDLARQTQVLSASSSASSGLRSTWLLQPTNAPIHAPTGLIPADQTAASE